MTSLGRRSGRSPRGGRTTPIAGDSGFTLVEVLLVVAVSGLLVGPLLAWMLLVLRQQPVEQDGMVRAAQASLLREYFVPDVVSAGAADDFVLATGDLPSGERWSTWREDCIGGGGADGRPLAVLLAERGGLVKTIYSVASRPDGTGAALWRDQCLAETGELLDSIELIERVLDDPARTAATCWSGQRNGAPDSHCRRVTMRVAMPDAEDLVQLSATRRSDTRSLEGVSDLGNILPIAIIDVERTPVEGTPAITVRVDGSRSTDPDGDDASLRFRWELPTGPEGSGAPVQVRDGVDHTMLFTEVGTYVVRLTVTDEADGSSSTYRRVANVTNVPPTAQLEVTPSPAVAGESVLSLSGVGSSDPDGAITEHQWRIRSDVEEAEGLELFLSGATAEWPVPEWAFGNLVVELTVTDDRGARHTSAVIVPVSQPLTPAGDEDVDPTDPVDPTNPADPVVPGPEPGDPVADFTVQVGANREVTLDASGSTGQDLTYSWNFGLLAGTGSGGPVVTHQYPSIGTYTVRLTVSDAQGATATRAALVVIPGQPQAPANVRVENGVLLWAPRPGARRYLVDMESIGQGCARAITDLATAASEMPRRALPPNPCGAGSTVRARVGTEAVAGGAVAWSAWVNVPNEVTK